MPVKSHKSSFSRYFMGFGFFYLRILKLALGKKRNSLLNVKFTYAPRNIVQKYFLFFSQVLSVCMFLDKSLPTLNCLANTDQK